MTSSRVVRGTKGRIIFCVCTIFVIIAIIACYNNTLSQLDDVRKTSDQCHQQQENLSTQLQVIFDYKQRLEKSLKVEKAEHQETKKILEAKIEEEEKKNEKAANEANLKFSSLQQHFNLLKTQHDDFKEEYSKTQQQQLDEINILQAKLKEVQGQMKKSVNDKDNALEHLKSQYMQLQVDKENIQKEIKTGQNKDIESDSEINHLTKINHELQRELDILKAKCSTSTKAQDISIGPQNQISPPANASNHNDEDVKNQPAGHKQEPANVADLPSNVDEGNQLANEQLAAPKTEKPIVNNDANVLVGLPPGQRTSSTAKGNFSLGQLLHIPLVNNNISTKNKPSEETYLQQQNQGVLPMPNVKKVPDGVVPLPENHLETVAHANKLNRDEKEVRDNAFPNRYRTNLILNEMANDDKAKEAEKQLQIKEKNKENLLKTDTVDADNAALEEVDPPVNNMEADPFALDDTHGDKANVEQLHQKISKQHINSLGNDPLKLGKQGHKLYDGPADGVDYDKDMQNGIQDPEAEDDDPDYADPIARKDVAVRN